MRLVQLCTVEPLLKDTLKYGQIFWSKRYPTVENGLGTRLIPHKTKQVRSNSGLIKVHNILKAMT